MSKARMEARAAANDIYFSALATDPSIDEANGLGGGCKRS